MAIYDEDQETLAGEYVLGTLSVSEREQAEVLRSFDPGFEAAIRQWERRLGELNVMVEAVEPPPETWDKIRTQVAPLARNVESAEPQEPPALPALPPVAGLDTGLLPPDFESRLSAAEETPPPVADYSAGVPAPPPPPEPYLAAAEETPPPVADYPAAVPTFPQPQPQPSQQPYPIERSADIIRLRRRAGRWRGISVGVAAIAALLALYIALPQFTDLIPVPLRPFVNKVIANTQPAAPLRGQPDRLVAVLQQGPTTPAFLLTVDTQQRKLYIRRVSATPETGKSYELWLIAGRNAAPRSLGVVGGDEFTQRPWPANFDTDALRGATYAISLEPAGGSKTGAPTGPVLYTGKAVESLPPPPPPPQTPKT